MTSTPETPTKEQAEADETVADETVADETVADETVADETLEAIEESTSDTPTAMDRGREALEKGREAAGRVGEAVTHAASTVVERLRNRAELAEERGVTTIADEVVQKIAGIAAREVPGVHDLGGEVSRVFASLKERIGLGESDNEQADNGVSVKLVGTTAEIVLTIVIEFGYVVHSVTDAVRTKVISSVENMLGLEVTEVNIRVNDVHVPENGDGEAEPAAA